MSPISKAELKDLTTALEQASVKIDAVNQPLALAVEKLASEQTALAQEVVKNGKTIAQQQKTLDLQSKEIAALRQQISQDSSNWGIASVNWPTVITITLLASPMVVSSWFLIQRFVPMQLDINTAQKIDTLYRHYGGFQESIYPMHLLGIWGGAMVHHPALRAPLHRRGILWVW